MNEDSALFKYELAVVAILKNEAPYIKEWIDYHLIAGIEHFYIYDNGSEDNLKEILQPYIDVGIVDYEFFPGRAAQMAAYNDAVKKYRFSCKYMAFIDADEFIYPNENKSILETLTEILEEYSDGNVEGLAVNWHIFGSSGLEKADLSKGVLERFCYRAGEDFDVNKHIKTIANPRYIKLILNPHYAVYYERKISINEIGKPVMGAFSESLETNKIRINHYFTKSKEEYIRKKERGKADNVFEPYDISLFESQDKNDVYDDSILSYIEMRTKTWNKFVESPFQINQRIFKSLLENLSPAMLRYANDEFFQGKSTLFLTCWAVTQNLKESILNEKEANFFEELSLNCLYKSLTAADVEVCQVELLIDEFIKISLQPFPVVEDIKELIKKAIPQIMEVKQIENLWTDYRHLEYILQLL